ncbi:MAG TPA: SDR family NAD(P)-dependent oxidoreductase, partial [Nitriliruptoraceae bacterium]|nr:SDR family NAD(P)-dependent oxidoreductase [Nitriliruptoraceae bacterium]
MTTWFISGASSGIGAELARQVARRGDDVAVAARRVDRLRELAQGLASAPGRVTVHELDVTDHAAVEQVLHAVDDACGGLDVVVANAGIGGGSRIGSGDQDANAAVVATNL